MLKQKTRFPLGAHLIVKHFGYSHHGIYAGRGRVIHYSGFAHLFKKHPIEMTSMKSLVTAKILLCSRIMRPSIKAAKWYAVCAPECMKTIII